MYKCPVLHVLKKYSKSRGMSRICKKSFWPESKLFRLKQRRKRSNLMFSCYLKQEIFRLFRWARTWAVLFPFLCSLSFQCVFKKESTRDEQSHDGLEQVERATQAFGWISLIKIYHPISLGGRKKALRIFPVLFSLFKQKYLQKSVYNSTMKSPFLVFSGIRNHNANNKWKPNYFFKFPNVSHHFNHPTLV